MYNGSNGYRVFYLVLLVLTAWFTLETFMKLDKIPSETGFFESFCTNCSRAVTAYWVPDRSNYSNTEVNVTRRCINCNTPTYTKGLCILMLFILPFVILALTYGFIKGRALY